NPEASTGRHRGPSTAPHGQLTAHPAPAAPHPAHKTDIALTGSLLQHTDFNVDPRLAQLVQPLPRHLRVRVSHRHDHPAHTGANDRLGTGWRTTMMTAGLQRHIKGGAT